MLGQVVFALSHTDRSGRWAVCTLDTPRCMAVLPHLTAPSLLFSSCYPLILSSVLVCWFVSLVLQHPLLPHLPLSLALHAKNYFPTSPQKHTHKHTQTHTNTHTHTHLLKLAPPRPPSPLSSHALLSLHPPPYHNHPDSYPSRQTPNQPLLNWSEVRKVSITRAHTPR